MKTLVLSFLLFSFLIFHTNATEPVKQIVSITGEQKIMYNSIPAIIKGSLPDTLQTGSNYTYQWQECYDAIVWNNIPGATQMNYQPGILSLNTWFRLQIIYNKGFAVSNPILISVIKQ